MLHALYELWLRGAPGAGLLAYTSFRAAAAALTAFLLALVFGRPLIAWLRDCI